MKKILYLFLLFLPVLGVAQSRYGVEGVQMCWTTALGVDSSIVRYVLISTTGQPVKTISYENAQGAVVNVSGGVIRYGFCDCAGALDSLVDGSVTWAKLATAVKDSINKSVTWSRLAEPVKDSIRIGMNPKRDTSITFFGNYDLGAAIPLSVIARRYNKIELSGDGPGSIVTVTLPDADPSIFNLEVVIVASNDTIQVQSNVGDQIRSQFRKVHPIKVNEYRCLQVGAGIVWKGSVWDTLGVGGTTDIVNIVNEGAVGDGTTDNLSAIQTALNTYGMIYVPPGNFKISGTLVVPSGGKILGSGYNSIISSSVGDTLVRMRLNSTIESVRLDGTDAAGQVGVYWKGLAVIGVTVASCQITDMIQGVRVDSTGYGPYLSSTIRDCQIRSCGTGIYLGQRGEYIQLINNICDQNTTGIYMRAGNCSVTGGSTGANSVGLSVDGGANNAHTSITGLSSNHNSSKNLEIDSVSLGLLITGCNFFSSPTITINESNSIQMINCNVDCTSDHIVTNSTEIIYTNNIWWNATSDPTLNAGSKAAFIGNRTKGTQAVTTISAPNTTGAFPLNIEMPSTGNRGLNITREGVSSSAGFMGLWSQTSTAGIFAPFWYAKSNSNAYPHLAFIALNDAGSDTGTQPSIIFQAGDGYTNVNRPLFSFDNQLSSIVMRINVGGNLALGFLNTRQDSVRMAVRGRSTSATSFAFRAYDLANNVLFSVANNGVISTTSTIYRNSANTVGSFIGTGTPEGVVTASVGSIFHRTDGGAGTSFYIKESGAGNTGWIAK